VAVEFCQQLQLNLLSDTNDIRTTFSTVLNLKNAK